MPAAPWPCRRCRAPYPCARFRHAPRLVKRGATRGRSALPRIAATRYMDLTLSAPVSGLRRQRVRKRENSMAFQVNINGEARQLDVPAEMPLLWALRNE